jgi:hypothetical protein
MADHPDTGPDRGRHYQAEQGGMYELEVPAPQLTSPDGAGPVLIHALEGFSDAGHAIRLAASHLKTTLDSELVASFAIDDLLDYRSRRPVMTFKTDHFTHYAEPELSLYALRDTAGTPFLLLAGMEPDLKWERFITAVRLLAERLGVRRTIGLGTIPMAVPHTRPVTLTAHSNNRELISDFTPWIAEVQVPGSASNLLEYRMAQHGHEVVGFTVHVPHYVSQTDYPEAAEALLRHRAARCSCRSPNSARPRPTSGPRSTNRSRRAPRWLRWWRHWNASTTRSSPPRRTARCWRATRICPAPTNSAPSSNGSWPRRPRRIAATTATRCDRAAVWRRA